MALLTSTGLRNYMLVTGSARAALANGVIKIYKGTVPATADAAVSAGDLLVTISKDGDGSGFTLDSTASDGAVTKVEADELYGEVTQGGVATFYRHVLLADDGSASTTAYRVQGRIAMAGAEGNITNTTLVLGATQDVNSYVLALPTFTEAG